MTHEFKVEDMTCGHCVGRITTALHAFDPAARVSIDLAARKVSVDGAAGRSDYGYAIRDAGYTEVAIVSDTAYAMDDDEAERVLALGLAKETRDRFATAGELADWLAAAIHDGLTPEQRQRADDLVARQPWGTRQGIAS